MAFTIENYQATNFEIFSQPEKADFTIIGLGIQGDGVVSGCAVSADAPAAMNVVVGSGTIRIAGTNISVVAADVTITAAHATNDRLDVITVDAAGALAAVAGTASLAPALAPAIPASRVALAFVWVPAAATEVNGSATNDGQAKIEDKRFFVPTAIPLDHGSLIGLLDDDHTQYLLLAGRAGSQDIVDDITLSGFLRIGSNTDPTNVTAGDLTPVRLIIPDAAISDSATLQVTASSVPNASGNFETTLYATRTSSPDASTSNGDELHAGEFIHSVRPTAAAGGRYIGLRQTIAHDSGAFNLTRELVGLWAEAQQNVASSTLSTLRGAVYTIRSIAGTVTTATGMQVIRGVTGDAGAITTQFGIILDAITGVSPGTGIGIRIVGNASTSGTIGNEIALQILAASAGTITTHTAISIGNMGSGATVTNAIALDIAAQTGGATLNIGIRNAAPYVATPSVQQSIAVSAPIVANAEVVQVSTTTAANMTATPTVANGSDGQILVIVNTGANAFTLQDQGTLGGSNLRLSAAGVALATRDSIILMYSSAVGDWIQIGQTNVI